VDELGDPDARMSMQLWLELFSPTDMQGVLGALAQRDLLLWRWLTFTQGYPLVVMPTLGDLAPPHNLDTTREGQARVMDSIRVSLISPPCWGFLRWRCRSATMAVCAQVWQILAPRFREDLCLDAGETIEAAEGVVMAIDPVQGSATA
jgi:amidase